MYDLRSDTITKPGAGMRQAMHDAEVGDDVYLEDPSINKLQDKSAELMGKEAALFVPTGSMGNLIPIYLNCGRGNEVIAHEGAHILHYELGSLANLAGAMPAPVQAERGILNRDVVLARARPTKYDMARSRMVEVENTHNIEGGSVYQLSDLADVEEAAETIGASVHMDGARIFNAALAIGASTSEIAAYADTVTFCLSKGLGAPVGSVLCGTRAFIDEARRVRKMLGGGMRQAGVLAAAGIYALDNNVERLAEDHEHAKIIAGALEDVDWADIDTSRVVTNIIRFNTPDHGASEVVDALAASGVKCGAAGANAIRMVTSLEVDEADVQAIAGIIRDLSI